MAATLSHRALAACLAMAAASFGPNGAAHAACFEFQEVTLPGRPAPKPLAVRSEDAEFIRKAKADLALPEQERTWHVAGEVDTGKGVLGGDRTWHLKEGTAKIFQGDVLLCGASVREVDSNPADWMREREPMCRISYFSSTHLLRECPVTGTSQPEISPRGAPSPKALRTLARKGLRPDGRRR